MHGWQYQPHMRTPVQVLTNLETCAMQEAMSGLVSGAPSDWTPQASMCAVRSRLQTVLAGSMDIKQPQLLAMLQVCMRSRHAVRQARHLADTL